jgi:hypothetical protein
VSIWTRLLSRTAIIQLSIQLVALRSLGISNWTEVEVSIGFAIASPSFLKNSTSDSDGNLFR